MDETWGKGDPRLGLLKAAFPEIHNDKTDLYYYFLFQAVRQSTDYVRYIVSRAFMQAYKASRLRAWLAQRATVEEVVDFRNAQVFPGVGITTCLLRLRVGAGDAPVQVFEQTDESVTDEPLAPRLNPAGGFRAFTAPQRQAAPEGWNFAPEGVAALYAKIDRAGSPLRNVLTIGKGMETGCNDVFGERTRAQIEQWNVPSGLYFQRATNTDIRRYRIHDRGEYLLYPNGERAFSHLPPGVREHLTAHAARLKARAAFKRGDCQWWQYTWPLNAGMYDRPRILCPYLATGNRFALDDSRQFLSLTDTTVLFAGDHREDLRYLLALLNSRLLTFRFRSIGKMKGGGVIEYFWNSVSRLPIRRIDFALKADRERHDRLAALAGQMSEAVNGSEAAVSDNDRDYSERLCKEIDRHIDRLVYELYGLTEDEIRIVEAG